MDDTAASALRASAANSGRVTARYVVLPLPAPVPTLKVSLDKPNPKLGVGLMVRGGAAGIGGGDVSGSFWGFLGFLGFSGGFWGFRQILPPPRVTGRVKTLRFRVQGLFVTTGAGRLESASTASVWV